MFTGDTLIASVVIAFTIGAAIGNGYGRRRPRRRVTYEAPGPGPLRVNIANGLKR